MVAMRRDARISRLVFFLTLLAASYPRGALSSQSALSMPAHIAARFTIANGLPSNFVSDLAPAADGRLWVLSGGVLVRFDGEHFETVPVGDRRLWTHAEQLLGIESNGSDTLLVATSRGSILMRAGGRWQLQPVARQTSASAVQAELWSTHGAMDRSGTPWLLATGDTIAQTVPAEAGRIMPVVTGRLVRTGDRSGPLGVRRRGGQLELVTVDGRVRARLADAAGRIPLLLTRDGRVLAASIEGLEVHHPEDKDRIPERFPLAATGAPHGGAPNAGVWEVFEDASGDILVGTHEHGLIHLRRSSVREVTLLAGASGQRQIRTLSSARDGSMLAIADRLYRIRGASISALSTDKSVEGKPLYAAAEDAQGGLWLSAALSPTQSVIVARQGETIRRFLRQESAIRFLEDSVAGVMRWLEPNSMCRVSLAPLREAGVSPQCIALGDFAGRDLLRSRDGAIWLAGAPGVHRLDEGEGAQSRWRRYDEATGYPLALARALYEDRDGILWVGIYGGGLARLERRAADRDSLVIITMRDGLAEDVVSSIMEDDGGMLWMSGNAGIQGIARADIARLVAGELNSISPQRIDHRDGLSNAEGSGWQGARDGRGRLWFPTFGGAVTVDPRLYRAITAPPRRALIDAITVDTTSLRIQDTVVLADGMRAIDVHVAAVNLHSPGTERVEYRLGGRGDSWRPVLNGRTVRLSGLLSGRWQLEVRTIGARENGELVVDSTARDGDDHGLPGGARSSLLLVVPPAFHETFGFRLLFALGFGALLVAGVAVRTRVLSERANQLQLEVDRQMELVRREHQNTVTALAEAHRAGRQLRDLLMAKSHVFASLSHELRTPLSLITGPLRALQREAQYRFPPTARGYLGALGSAVRRLERLTAQFLDMADQQSGTLSITPQRVNVTVFLQQCIEAIAPLAAEREVRLTLTLPGGPPIEASLDPDHMDKVVTNLLANAIRHSPSPGEVRVRLEYAGDNAQQLWTMTVSDDGTGVPEPYRERIFEPFFQAPGAQEGMGLGLALTSDVVVLHGGRLELVPPFDAGANFRVTLARIPTSQHSSVADSSQQAAGLLLDSSRAAAESTPEDTSETPDGLQPAHVALQRGRVLVAEDDVALRRFLVEQLRETHDVRAVGDGEEALQVLRDWPADLVVSDVVMPRVDGVALCRILKNDPATRNLPVLLLTARGKRDDQLFGLAAGADDYIVKPFDMDALRLRIDNLIRLRQSIEERFRGMLPAWSSILLRDGTDRLDRPSEQFLARLYGVLTAHISDQSFNVERMTRALDMSRASLYRRVATLLKTTPPDLLVEIRLEHAALLLRTQDDTVASIAHRTGFKWPHHFTRRFSAHFGMTPSAYRGTYFTKKESPTCPPAPLPA